MNKTYYYYRGRVALYAILRSLRIQPGDEVLIPAFTCIAVPSPILSLKAKPVYVDVDPLTCNISVEDMERKITKRSRVIIAQHTFGIPCEMDSIMAIANRHGLVVIEDTCHVWGGKYKGRDLGSIGAAAFYSYDPGKPFIIGMGGAAVVNSASLNVEMQRHYQELNTPPMADTLRLHLQYFAHRLTRHPRLFWRVRDLFRFLSRRGVAIATWTRDTLGETVSPDYGRRLAPSLEARLCAMQRRGSAVIARHKRLARLYEDGLRAMGLAGVGPDPKLEPVLICYPIQVADKQALLQEARREQVELGDWFSTPVHPLCEEEWKIVGYLKGSCPLAERVANRIVTLPCHGGVTTGEANRTLAFLRRMQMRGFIGEQASSQQSPVKKVWNKPETRAQEASSTEPVEAQSERVGQ